MYPKLAYCCYLESGDFESLLLRSQAYDAVLSKAIQTRLARLNPAITDAKMRALLSMSSTGHGKIVINPILQKTIRLHRTSLQPQRT